MCKIKYLLLLLTTNYIINSQSNDQFDIIPERISNHILTLNFTGVSVTSILTSDGIILFDTHRSPGIMQKIKEIISREFGTDVYKYVINTHGHWDHVGGNALFKNSEIIAHENAEKSMSITPPNTPGMSAYAKSNISRFEENLRTLKSGSDESKTRATKYKCME